MSRCVGVDVHRYNHKYGRTKEVIIPAIKLLREQVAEEIAIIASEDQHIQNICFSLMWIYHRRSNNSKYLGKLFPDGASFSTKTALEKQFPAIIKTVNRLLSEVDVALVDAHTPAIIYARYLVRVFPQTLKELNIHEDILNYVLQ